MSKPKLTENQLKQLEEDKKTRTWTMLFTGMCAAVVVAAVALAISNSGLLTRNTPAVTINGTEYSTADVSYYYTNAYQYEAYLGSMGMSALDPYTKPQKQQYDENTTWHEHLLELAVDNLTQEAALNEQAQKAGHVLSEDAKADMQASLNALETGWISAGYSNRDAYLTATFGNSMTYEKFAEILERSSMALDYGTAYGQTLEYDQAALDTYYNEHRNELDTFEVSQFLFQAQVDTVDEEGNSIEMTDEEIAAALDAAKAEAKAQAEEMMARLKAGEDAQTLTEEYADSMGYSYIGDRRLGTSVNAQYSEWVFSDERKDGDITMVEYSGGTFTYNYCVVRLDDRYLDRQNSANIRHILVSAGSNPTDEEYAEAQAKAEEMLELWKTGGADEDSFAQLASENSADTSSAANGGLLNVSNYNSYGQPFVDWSLDSSRKAGDTGLVKNDFSTTKGYHIMYYVGEDAPYWEKTAVTALRNDDISAWIEELVSSCTVEEGAGLKNVG